MDNEQIFMRAAEILQASGIDPQAAFAEAEKTANDALDGAALELLANLGYEVVETEEKTADDELTMQALEFLGTLGYQVQQEAEKTAEEVVLEDMVENRAAQMLLESGIHPLTGAAIEKTAEAIDAAANEFLAYKAELVKEAAGKKEKEGPSTMWVKLPAAVGGISNALVGAGGLGAAAYGAAKRNPALALGGLGYAGLAGLGGLLYKKQYDLAKELDKRRGK